MCSLTREAEHNRTSPIRSAIEREAAKSDQERAEDIVYTINHAAACTTLDTLNTPVEMLSQKYFGTKISTTYCVGCATGEHAIGFHGDKDTVMKRGQRWIVAEWVGDWLGVVPTIAMQRYAPGVMAAIGQASTYVAGPAFRWGADRSAIRWGNEHGLAADDAQVKQHADEIYAHEIEHLPQAIVWAAFSTPICLATLRAQGDKYTLASNLTAKLMGVSTSFFGILGARAAAPDTMSKWDEWAGKNVVTPITKVIADTIGIERPTVDKVLTRIDEKKQHRPVPASHSERLLQSPKDFAQTAL